MEHKQHVPLWYLIILPCALAIITAIIYYPSLHFAFQFDDLPNITKHFYIRHNTFWDLFFSGSRWISYWLNAIHYSIGKFDPFSYRVGNLIIHIMNGMLIFAIFYFLLSRLKNQSFFTRHALSISTLTAALFLMHPAHTQTVSYVIQGQLEGLATMSVLLLVTLYTWHAYARAKIFKIISAFLLLACAAFACSTKEITIVAPALLALVDWFLIAQGEVHQIKSRLWLLGCVTAIMGSLYVYFLKPSFLKEIFSFKYELANNIGNRLTPNPGEKITPYYFFISQFKVIVHYLSMYLWPFNMSVEYDWKLATGIFTLNVIVPLSILASIGFILFRLLKKNPISPVAFGAFWFFVCVAPRSSFIVSSELLSDYKAYMASIGWLFILAVACIKLGDLIGKVIRKKKQHEKLSYLPIGTASFILLLIGLPLGFASKHQNMIWSSGLEFWGAMIKNAPGKARAYNNYGVELGQNLKRWKESIPYYQKAIEMDNRYPDPCNNLAVAYAQLNDIDNAIKAIQISLQICPNFPEGYNNLGAFYIQKNDLAKALENVQTAIKLRPYYGKAHYNLGRIYLLQGKLEEAWQSFKDCCTKADMDTEAGFECYAQASFVQKKYDDAIFACKKILELNPRHENALLHLGSSYHALARYEEAAQAFEQMLHYYPLNQSALFNAGETYLRMKQPQQALAYFQKSQRLPGNEELIASKVNHCNRLIAEANA